MPQTARARATRADNPLADPPKPRFRLVHSASPEEFVEGGGEPDGDEQARQAYIERLEASPERPELEPTDRKPAGSRRTVQVSGRPKEPESARVASPDVFAPRTARARDRRGLAPIATAQLAARPDRVAMWAVMLGLFLAFMAIATGAH